MITANQVISKIEENKEDIRNLSVQKIGLFGSVLTGKADRRSDIDILVKFRTPTYDNYMDLKFMLEGMFKRKVDLVLEDSLKKHLRYVKKDALYAEAI
jgi:predicted nucleotidyltransferase